LAEKRDSVVSPFCDDPWGGIAAVFFAPSSREEITMKRFVRLLPPVAIVLLFVTIAAADTLELKDGRVLDGRYLGGTQAVLRFQVEGNIQR